MLLFSVHEQGAELDGSGITGTCLPNGIPALLAVFIWHAAAPAPSNIDLIKGLFMATYFWNYTLRYNYEFCVEFLCMNFNKAKIVLCLNSIKFQS